MKPTIVNHGAAFGHCNWYTFYCPICKIQLDCSMLQKNEGKCNCGQTIDIKYK